MSKHNHKDLEDDDIEIRIQKLKEQAETLSGRDMHFTNMDESTPEIEEQFCKNVVALEQAAWSQPFQLLTGSGMSLPPAEDLNDLELTAKLWEVIKALALLHIYLENTNHLSDRELYTHLWNESLREELILQPANARFACHIDLVGSGSEEDNNINLKYYADKDERTRWAQEWPDDPLPAREKQPFDRDQHLPKSVPTEEDPRVH